MGETVSSSSVPSPSLSQYPVLNQKGHVVQFYQEDGYLVETVSRFVGSSLAAGDASVVIATKPHRAAIDTLLKARALDIAKVVNQHRYFALDAGETLSRFLVNGMPDPNLFKSVIGKVLDEAASAVGGEGTRIAAFGEMVNVLWASGQYEAALRLEQLWNELSSTRSFALLCAYPISGFEGRQHTDGFLRVCREHGAVLPSESYSLLDTAEERLRKVTELQQAVLALQNETIALRAGESFRLFIDAVRDYAIFMLDAQGCITTWNTGAERIKGYKSWEIIGKHFSVFYPEEDLRNRKPWRELEVAAEDGRFEDEGWRLRKDGTRFWANVVITALKDENGKIRGFGKVTRDITERLHAHQALKEANANLEKEVIEKRNAEQKLHRSEDSLRRLSLHLLRTQDEERRRIGRDLHDSLGQYLAVLKMNLDSLQLTFPSSGNGAQQVSSCIRLVEDAIKEVRTISYLLYPPMLEELGLKSAIPWYLDGFARRSEIKTAFEITPDFARLSREVELALFRVLQESLTNVHRHSGSPTAAIRLFAKDDQVILEVEDHGKGLPANILEAEEDELPAELGVGLRGMNERIRQLGGRVETVSPGVGTIVRAIVPAGQSSFPVSMGPKIAREIDLDTKLESGDPIPAA
jgi:PAS domain S-box-containing protein